MDIVFKGFMSTNHAGGGSQPLNLAVLVFGEVVLFLAKGQLVEILYFARG